MLNVEPMTIISEGQSGQYQTVDPQGSLRQRQVSFACPLDLTQIAKMTFPPILQYRAPAAVVAVPRLFITQLPKDKNESDIELVFSKFGQIEKTTVIRNLDGSSKGCGMVLFKTFTEAEVAQESTTGMLWPLSTSDDDVLYRQPIIVSFAQPRKPNASYLASEQIIAPKKLFVGQLPKSLSNEEVTGLFAQFGEIDVVNVLRPKNSQAGCAFVLYKKWASCEAAIHALHDKRPFHPASDHPLVVKFADVSKKNELHYPARHSYPSNDVPMHHMGMMYPHPAMMSYGGYYGWPPHYVPGIPHMPLPRPPVNSSNRINGGRVEGGSSSENLNSLYTADDSSNDGSNEAYCSPQEMQASPYYGVFPPEHYAQMQYMAAAAAAPGTVMRIGAKLGRGVSDPSLYAHKLFIGQLPFEIVESDLWNWFAEHGEILELAILRSQGRSKGCAFLTYATRDQAVLAMSACHGKRLARGKKLVVKFANSGGTDS